MEGIFVEIGAVLRVFYILKFKHDYRSYAVDCGPWSMDYFAWELAMDN
jgi:hypothetical protein